MKTINVSQIIAVLSAVALAAFVTPAAQAGPGSRELYHTVTVEQAAALPVGEHLAISCGNCGGITAITVDKDRAYLHRFVCAMCKREFHAVSSAHGSTQFYYVDREDHRARLTAANPR